MFFFWGKKKNQIKEMPVPETFVYHWTQAESASDEYLWVLSHSGREGGDVEDFTAISKELLRMVFSELWVSMWIYDGNSRDYLLPKGQHCMPPKCFSQVSFEYLQHTERDKLMLVKEDAMVLFSHGIDLRILEAYLSDVSDAVVDRSISFWGYKETFEHTGDFQTEEARREKIPCNIFAYFDEFHDNLWISFKVKYDSERILQFVQQICDKYGKELRISCKNDDSP